MVIFLELAVRDKHCIINNPVSNVVAKSDVIASPIVYFLSYLCCIAEMSLWIDMKGELNL